MRQAEQGPLHPIYGGGLVLLCPNRTPRQPNDTPAKGCRNEHAGQLHDDGETLRAALGQVTASRGALQRRNPVGQARNPVDQMHAGSTRGRPSSSRLGRDNHGNKAARSQQGLRGIEMALLRAISIPRLSIAGARGAVRSAGRRSRSERTRRHEACSAARATRHAAVSDPGGRLTGTPGRPLPVCRDFPGFRVPG